MFVTTRDKKLVEFDLSRIKQAIDNACVAIGARVPQTNMEMLLTQIHEDVCATYKIDNVLTIDDIQKSVIFTLMEYPWSRAIAEEYVIYSYLKNMKRSIETNEKGLLSNNFLRTFKHSRPPMTDFGNFVYLRTYARFLDAEKRREFWWEIVKRSVEYNCSIVNTSREEAEELFENIFNLKQFLSGRTHWVGGTPAAELYGMSNFNCAFLIVNEFEAFRDLFYALMIGSGVGIRVLKDDVDKLPPVRTDVKIIHEEYRPRTPQYRQELTSLDIDGTDAVIVIGDSKEGWAESIDLFFKLLSSHMYRKVTTICINYDNIRMKGEPLKTFGGTASGHQSMLEMFKLIWKVIQNRKDSKSTTNKVVLSPIDCADIANIVGLNVRAGGVRRTAEIILFDADDVKMKEAKKNLYINGNINPDIAFRQMSNNTAYYKFKPAYTTLLQHIQEIKKTGEPGFLNEQAAMKRRENFNGINPCGEILLDNKGLCNLTTINVVAFVVDGMLQMTQLLRAAVLSARAAYRMTFLELELPKWDIVQKRDKIVGCSLTGWQDMVNLLDMDKEAQAVLLQTLRDTIHEALREYAAELNSEVPIASTTIKPEGTLSCLPTVSSGVHYSHSPYYIRRVRVSSDDAMIRACEDLRYPVFPEVGQDPETCDTKVVEFPVHSPEGKTKADVSALEQLDNYLMFMKNYVDHNCSITIHVRDHEWDEITKAIYDNWDDIVAISLIPYSDSYYQLLPYEEITQEEYEKRKEKIIPITPSMLRKYEKQEKLYELKDDDCVGGQCPIR